MIAHKRLLEVLTYDPATGIFRWRVKLSKKTVVGSEAGCKRKDGYVRIRIDKADYLAHRLAVFYMVGQWPKGDVDHKDGDPSHNWFCNLRDATHQNNICNQKKSVVNTSGYKGVSFHKASGLYRARIETKGVVRSLGYYATPQEAYTAYCVAAHQYHGQFARVI